MSKCKFIIVTLVNLWWLVGHMHIIPHIVIKEQNVRKMATLTTVLLCT